MGSVRAVAFDFDGVVVESVALKNLAFGELFRDSHPEKVDEIVRFQAENVGLSRYEKFPLIYERLLGEPFPEGEMERLDAGLSALVFEGVRACSFVAGAEELIIGRSTELPLYVASATPEDEVRRLVALRGLAPYFHGVFGSPTPKPEILRQILVDEGLAPDELLFVGDASGDYAAARATSVRFVGRVPLGEENPFDGVPVVADLAELDRRWDVLVGGPA